MVINIGQFLDKDTTGHGWGGQQWLEAYSHALQHVGEAAEGRHWTPMCKGFAPKVSLLVEAFIGVTGVWVAEDCAMSCWNDPLEDIPHQSNESVHANVISYLDELAMCQLSWEGWDELVWLRQPAVPHMAHQNKHVGYIQGCMVELGPIMPPSQLHVRDPGGEFICFTRGLIFEGNVLTYDPSTNRAEWILVHSTASDLLWVEEMSALALCNMVLCVMDEGAERLDRFRECRDENERGGAEGASSAGAPHKEETEVETLDEDDREEEGHNAEDEDADEESKSKSNSGFMQESPCSTHHYSDRCQCCPHGWVE